MPEFDLCMKLDLSTFSHHVSFFPLFFQPTHTSSWCRLRASCWGTMSGPLAKWFDCTPTKTVRSTAQVSPLDWHTHASHYFQSSVAKCYWQARLWSCCYINGLCCWSNLSRACPLRSCGDPELLFLQLFVFVIEWLKLLLRGHKHSWSLVLLRLFWVYWKYAGLKVYIQRW